MQARSILGRHIDGVDDVLDANRNAMEHANGPSLSPVLVTGASLCQGEFLIEKLPSLHLGFALANPIKAGLNQLFRTN
jgi:hypothetical protein